MSTSTTAPSPLHHFHVAVAALALATGCATASRIPITPVERPRLQSTRTIAGVMRQELGTTIVVQQTQNQYGAIGGLVGALVDGAVNDSRTKGVEAAIVPVRNALVGQEPGPLFLTALQKELAAVDWLPGNVVELRTSLKDEELPDLVYAVGTHTVLVVRADHRLSPTFDRLVVDADVRLMKRVLPAKQRASPETPFYSNTFSVQVAVPPSKVRAASPLEQAAKRWSEADGKAARLAVEGAFAELARMIAYDLGEPGAAGDAGALYKNLKVRQHTVVDAGGTVPSRGFEVRKEGERTWIRTEDGPLFSIGPVYPEPPAPAPAQAQAP